MRVVFSPEARLELVEAQRFYNLKRPELGDRLFDEMRSALPRVQRWPLSCPVERGDIRRLALTRFPYKLLYAVEEDHIYVIAVAHQHRKPDYWIGRTSPGS